MRNTLVSLFYLISSHPISSLPEHFTYMYLIRKAARQSSLAPSRPALQCQAKYLSSMLMLLDDFILSNICAKHYSHVIAFPINITSDGDCDVYHGGFISRRHIACGYLWC